MDDPPYPSLFAPKPGLTKQEQKKVAAFIKAGKMKRCPAMGSPELTRLNQKQAWKWAKELTKAMRIKLGMNPRKKYGRDKRP